MDERLLPVNQMLQEALIQVQESHQELRHYLDSLDLDPERLSLLDERLSRSMALSRKHHVRPQALYAHHQQLASELAALSADDARLDSLRDELGHLHAHYIEQAHRLSASRKRHADELAQRISSRIQALAMPHGQLTIQVQPHADATPSALGQDLVEFLVTTNPGGNHRKPWPKWLRGELSRISLAIQVITAERIATPSLIFDEVDVGISGLTANVVGKLLRELGARPQVLVVTHLPQVAGQTPSSLSVSKRTVMVTRPKP